MCDWRLANGEVKRDEERCIDERLRKEGRKSSKNFANRQSPVAHRKSFPLSETIQKGCHPAPQPRGSCIIRARVPKWYDAGLPRGTRHSASQPQVECMPRVNSSQNGRRRRIVPCNLHRERCRTGAAWLRHRGVHGHVCCRRPCGDGRPLDRFRVAHPG